MDPAYDGTPSRQVLADHALVGGIASKGVPAPVRVGRWWVVERTHAWMNGYGRLRRCCERDGAIVDFYLCLAAASLPGRRVRRRPCTHPSSPKALPLGGAPDHTPPEVMPILGRSKLVI